MPKPDLGAQYREAKAAVPEHLRRQAVIELEQGAYIKTLRGVPADQLYDRTTGAPLDPHLLELEQRIAKAELDVVWCRCLVVACGEAYKGESFADVQKRHQPKVKG